jgi:RNA polymerase sigma factor (sigma-70 family)
MADLNQAYAEYIADPAGHESEFFTLCTRKAEQLLRHSVSNASQDVAQQAVVELWRTMSKFNPAKGSFSTWFGLITRSCRDAHLAGQYREAEVIDSYSEVNNAGDVADGDDTSEDDSAAVRTKSSRTLVEPNLNAIDLHKLMQVPGIDPRLVALLVDGRSQAECARLLGTTRRKIRTQISHLRKALGHLHIAQK